MRPRLPETIDGRVDIGNCMRIFSSDATAMQVCIAVIQVDIWYSIVEINSHTILGFREALMH